METVSVYIITLWNGASIAFKFHVNTNTLLAF